MLIPIAVFLGVVAHSWEQNTDMNKSRSRSSSKHKIPKKILKYQNTATWILWPKPSEKERNIKGIRGGKFLWLKILPNPKEVKGFSYSPEFDISREATILKGNRDTFSLRCCFWYGNGVHLLPVCRTQVLWGTLAVRDCLDAGGLIMRPLSAVNENL